MDWTPGRIITGLDIGSYAIKGVELRAGLRGIELLRFEQGRLPDGGPPEEREAAIFDFMNQTGLSDELVVCALPADRITQRHLRFPFSDRRRVAQAIPFEVDEDLAVPFHEVIAVHEIVLAEPDQTDVLVAVSPRREVAAYMQLLSLSGVTPRILELDGAVLANLSSSLHLADVGRLVLDIGHRTTNLCLLLDGKPLALRSIPIAGRHITEALAKDLGVAPEDAEEIKHEQGIFESPGTRPSSDGIRVVMDDLVRETRRSLESIVSDPLQAIAPSEIVLVGGSACIPGIEQYLKDQLGLPCSVLEVPLGDPELSPLAEAGTPVFAQATALALRGSPTGRVTSIDFRQGDLAYKADWSDLRGGLRLTAALTGLLLFLFLVGLVVQVSTRERRLDEVEARLAALYAETFPDAPPSADPFGEMEKKVRETRELADHLGVTGTGLSALEVMRELSSRIPPELDIALTELKVERYSIQARGFAKDFESVDRVRTELARYEWFRDVRLSDVVTDARRGGKSFNLTIRLDQES